MLCGKRGVMTRFRQLIYSGFLLGLLPLSTAAAGQVTPPTPPAPSSNASAWLAATAKRVSPADLQLLSRAQATLLGNEVSGKAWDPYLGIMPSLGTYRGIWNWDAAFHAVAVSHWDPELAHQQVEILFSKQLPDGSLPDVIYEDGRMVTTITKPPVMAWAVAVVDHRAPDDRWIAAMYPKLHRLGDYWLLHHGGQADGLFYYSDADTGSESGWDDSIRWDSGYQKSQSDDHRLYAIDLNCYMVSHYRAMAYLAQRLNKPEDAAHWRQMATDLATRINDRLWDDQLGFYVDRDRVTGKPGPALSPAGFMPLFVHIASPERAARMAKLAALPDKFFPGMPTAAYDTPGYKSSAYWRGPAWLNTSYFALKGLRDNGQGALAASMRATLLAWVAHEPSLREYYDSKNGTGAGAKAFGWSAAFTIAFVLDWDNDNLTWLFQ